MLAIEAVLKREGVVFSGKDGMDVRLRGDLK